jgi:hypothetical protein
VYAATDPFLVASSCGQLIISHHLLLQGFRKSRERVITLSDQDGGVEVVQIALEMLYTGSSNVEGRATIKFLRTRLNLFEFTDFLDLPDQRLQQRNVQDFDFDCKRLSRDEFNDLPALISALYRGCQNDDPYFKGCLAALRRSVPSWKLQDIGVRTSTDHLFWTMFKAFPFFATDTVFYMSGVYRVLEQELDYERTRRLKIIQRLSAQQRLDVDPQGAKALPWYQKMPSVENGTSEYYCEIQYCSGYFTDYTKKTDRKQIECPYCQRNRNFRHTRPTKRRERQEQLSFVLSCEPDIQTADGKNSDSLPNQVLRPTLSCYDTWKVYIAMLE